MYEVRVDGKDLIWRRHANQLRTKFAALPLADTPMPTVERNEAVTDQSQVPLNLEARVLRRSTRVRKPRVPWVPT